MADKKLPEYKMVPVDELREHPQNPRIHPESAIDKLVRSIEEFGFTQPILVSKDGYILAGHARLKASKKAGLTEVPAIFLDLSGDMADAYLIADNRLQEETEWDLPILKDLIEQMDTGNVDLELTGFSEDEIEDLMTQFYVEEEGEARDDDFDVDEAASEIEETMTNPGEVWQLGRHRLMIGDSTSLDDVLKLMGSKEADMVFTDPPYNVDYEGSDGKKIQNDSMEDAKFYQFLLDAFVAMERVTKPGGPIYVCHADSEGRNFRMAFEDAGFLMKQCLVWVKNSLVLGRQDYQWKHEPILYGWKPGASHKWYGGRKETTVIEDPVDLAINKGVDHTILTFTNGTKSIAVKVPAYEIVYEGTEEDSTVWRFEKPKKNGDHPTMKPIPLVAKAIKNSSKPGDAVLDPFAGSGSTLIAAEQLGRQAFLMEMDCVYADVICQRFEKFTGQKAIKISG